MDEFISDLQSTHWWLSAIIVGIIMNFMTMLLVR